MTKTGRRVVVLLNATTRRNAEGAVVGVVGIGQDVTAMRLAEDKARQYAGEYSERLCRSFDLSLDLVTQVDLAGLAPQIYYASPSFETVLGHPPSDVLGDYVQLRWLFPPSFFEHLPSITTQMRSGDDGCTVEYPMLHADGREVETRRWNPSFACCWLACLLLAGLLAAGWLACYLLSFFLSFFLGLQPACLPVGHMQQAAKQAAAPTDTKRLTPPSTGLVREQAFAPSRQLQLRDCRLT